MTGSLDWRYVRTVFAVATLLGVLNFVRRWFGVLANGDGIPWQAVAFDEIDAAWLVALMLLPIVPWARRFPPWHWRWLPAHVLVALTFAAVHTLGMYLTRAALYPVLGLGEYDYGALRYRFFMEGPIQIIIYTAVMCALYALSQVERAREAERLRSLLAQSQLQSLRLQLAPHFLFNTLNTISAVVYESPAKADALIGRLGRMLRALLHSDARHLVDLEQELSIVREYVDIQRARFEQAVSYEVLSPAAHGSLKVPSMILQPLVENVFKYGSSEPEQPAVDGHVAAATRIELTTESHDALLIVRLRDHGPGLRDGAPTRWAGSEGHGLGLRNIRERLELLYGDEASLDVRNAAEGGVLAELRIPQR